MLLNLNKKTETADWENNIFTTPYYDFDKLALDIFQIQYKENKVYHQYVRSLKIDPKKVLKLVDIPFLPISFFKTHEIISGEFNQELVFESSGTTGETTSRHFVKSVRLYQESFSRGFNIFYGSVKKWCILGLLPGYLERSNSSLVKMVADLIDESENPRSGFYLHNHETLYQTLVANEIAEQPSLLIGVTYSLLDFAEKYSLKLKYTTIMETGGMKGKREEITREEVHRILEEKLGVKSIHSEYGMTELLSQAYSQGKGIFQSPPWMQVLIREYNDPFAISDANSCTKPVGGLINIIDLANLYSCSFIATDDVGKLYKNAQFEILGRRDASDLRGCSLMTAV
ncbi:MAG: acyl transferase [Ginsengibacter sp.]